MFLDRLNTAIPLVNQVLPAMMPYLRKPVPLWLFLVILLIVSSLIAGVFLVPRLSSPRSDFQLSLSPPSVIVRPEAVMTSLSFGDENASTSLLTIKSLNGFLGSVSISASSPSGVGVKLAGSSVLLGSDAALFGLNTTMWMAVAAASLGDYPVTIVATSGSLSHTAILTVHSRDVRVQPAQMSFPIQQGLSVQSQLFFSSLNGFAGNVSLSESPVSIFPNSGIYSGRWLINATLGSNSVFLNSRTVSVVTLTISAGDFVGTGNYTFTTLASYGNWRWNVQALAKVTVAPEPSLPLVAFSILSPKNTTLTLQNTGPAEVQITSYDVTDSTGDSVGGCYWGLGCYRSVFLAPSATQIIQIPLTLCASCGSRGNPFTYQTSQTYTVVVFTSRNNSFTYTVHT